MKLCFQCDFEHNFTLSSGKIIIPGNRLGKPSEETEKDNH